MKIKNVYLDMDGVLCDFEKQFIKLYGKEALSHRDRKEFSSNWSNFITDKNFEKLDWFPGAEELLVFIRKYDVNVEILTSSGGKKFHDEVSEQKRIWLKSHYIAYKPNVVSGRKFKKDDYLFKKRWQNYHQQNATLQWLCRKCNLSKKKIDE